MTLTSKDKQDIKDIVAEQLAIQKKEILQEIDKRIDLRLNERFVFFETRIITAVSDMIGALADNLDDAYAPKSTEEEMHTMKTYLRALP